MTLSTQQLATLRSEIQTDPMSLGYAGKDVTTQAGLINTVGLSNETVAAVAATASSLLRALNLGELAATPLSSTAQWLVNLAATVAAGEPLNPCDSQFVTMREGLFPAGTYPQTHAALLALATRRASRAEVVFGAGITIDSHDISLALGG